MPGRRPLQRRRLVRPGDDTFKLWYHAGWFDGTALATSSDGLNWERPTLDVVPGTNAVIEHPPDWRRDGALVWLDADAEPPERSRCSFSGAIPHATRA